VSDDEELIAALTRALELERARARGLDRMAAAQRRALERHAEEAGPPGIREATARRRAAQLSAELQRARDENEARRREIAQLMTVMTTGLESVRGDLDRVARSTAWRYGHAVVRVLNRLRGRRDLTAGAVAAAQERVALMLDPLSRPAFLEAATAPVRPAIAEERLAELRAELAETVRGLLGHVPRHARWPHVSVLVVNRNGEEHLRRLFAGLDRATDYPSFDVVLVDNASTDGSLALAEQPHDFAVTTIANADNRSFSTANNQALERCTGEIVVLLNNDVVPFERGWLRELVACLQRAPEGLAGATLLRDEPVAEEGPWLVQHSGVTVFSEGDVLRARNVADGRPFEPAELGDDRSWPAATAACLAVRRDVLVELGGLQEGYRFGTEDVDLGLSMHALGRPVVVSGRAVAIHAESATQNIESREFRRLNRLVNRQVMHERWGPQLRREIRLARLDGDGPWCDSSQYHVAVTRTSNDEADGWGDWYTAQEIGEALEGEGLRVTFVERKGDRWYELPEDVDAVLILLDAFDATRIPDRVLKLAWIRNWTDRWLERPWLAAVDVLFASSGRTRELLAAAGRTSELMPLAANANRFRPDRVDPDLETDYVFTGNRWGEERAVQRALVPGPGERVAVYGRGWPDVPELRDVAKGAVAYDRLPAVYASTKLVVDDTASPTLPYGAVNARVFDALASGALPVTNCEAGVRELFDEDFPVWTDADSLRGELDRLLGDDSRRAKLAGRYRQRVLERHTYAHRAKQLRRALRDAERRASFCLRIGAPNWEVADRWGDLHFARAVERELRRRGHRTTVQVLSEWDDLAGMGYDVVVTLRGLSAPTPKPSQLNVLWNISHPEAITAAECDAHDLVLVASRSFAEHLQRQTATPVDVLDQATDPARFFPDPDPALAHDVIFVGNSRGVRRKVLDDLLPTKLDLAIWGGGWEKVPRRFVKGTHLPNEELRHAYSAAGIVLNDHWPEMREWGFVSNRIYDAVACGSVVVSDAVTGLDNRFGPAVVTYEHGDELEPLLRGLLADRAELRRRGEQGRRRVLAAHTFSHRVEALLEAVERRAAETGHRARIRGTDQPVFATAGSASERRGPTSSR